MSEQQFSRAGTWYPGIEALRGIAALTVVADHAWSLSNQPHFPGYWIVEGFGTFGVDLFFLLSGFLLANTFWCDYRKNTACAVFDRTSRARSARSAY